MTQLRILQFTVFLFLAHVSGAQQLSPRVIAVSGGYFTNATGSVSFTVGEMCLVQTYTSATGVLTQGFQQPFDIITALAESKPDAFGLDVFPNPSDGQFYLSIHAASAGKAAISIVNVLGESIFHEFYALQQGPQRIPINVVQPLNGLFILTVTVNHNTMVDHRSRKIQILNRN